MSQKEEYSLAATFLADVFRLQQHALEKEQRHRLAFNKLISQADKLYQLTSKIANFPPLLQQEFYLAIKQQNLGLIILLKGKIEHVITHLLRT